ncbi:hypothetical protein [Singulisphaera acidiphila]|uniref:Periplasmic component of the Tol biopolymer transport system n=1 Tax=Singulisphaera acidiphila (strain ATCC BAA-1392 / DSM 18658 / VKM B-2454 / MOB10) TaxID=886293 RepID=L0DR48_SINAD|nr:hypothetical protein [Singulisphaera acidiphila]AGA31498.1 hypothetical protein Sinac_7464 [Singulisphaera acidiphila DSM 18658]
MRLVLSLMVRLIVAIAITLTVVAVPLGRHNLRYQEGRRLEAPRFQPFNGFLFGVADSLFRVLDLETGTTKPIRLADGGHLMHAACSPWRDGQGRTHVVGVWTSAAAAGPQVVGLARYALPTGELLDQVDGLVSMPNDCPCWFPDTTLQALFAGGDGELYRVSFESSRGGRVSGNASDIAPTPVAWPERLALPGSPKLSELTWPIDPRLGRRLIATLTYSNWDSTARKQPRSQLWWLRLTPDGSAIVEGGRLIRSCPASRESEQVREERLAAVSSAVDGRLMVAYLVRRGARSELDLQLAPLTIDPATGNPWVDEADAVTCARNRTFAPLAFSSDGCWIYSFARWPLSPASLERFSVVNLLHKRMQRFAVTMRSADLGTH